MVIMRLSVQLFRFQFHSRVATCINPSWRAVRRRKLLSLLSLSCKGQRATAEGIRNLALTGRTARPDRDVWDVARCQTWGELARCHLSLNPTGSPDRSLGTAAQRSREQSLEVSTTPLLYLP